MFLLHPTNARPHPPPDQPPREPPPSRSDAEQRFWQAVRSRQLDGFKFRFQHTIWPYIVDFVCLEAMLVVELDGGQHSPEGDAERTAFIEAKGFKVLRFWNNDVLTNLEGVAEVVLAELVRRSVR